MSNTSPGNKPGHPEIARWYHPGALTRALRNRPRVYLAIAAALAAGAVSPAYFSLSARAVIGWICGATIYLCLAFSHIAARDTHAIEKRAAQEDETRFVFAGLILIAIASSFAAVVGLIGEAKAAQDAMSGLYFALAAIAIFLSWLVMQVVFTLHYAHDFYRKDGGKLARGLEFPKDDHPDYWDFFYFTTSIGAASQTSDVSITSKEFRRLVAFQAILSFVFNTTVIALAINLAAGVL